MSSSQDIDMLEFSNLPPVVTVEILKHLRHADFNTARLVCYEWYKASKYFDPPNKFTIHVTEDNYWMPEDLFKIMLSFFDISFKSILEDRMRTWLTYPNAWSDVGPSIKCLNISWCKFAEEQLFTVLKHCTNLKNLQIHSCEVTTSAVDATGDSSCSNDTSSLQLSSLEEFSFESFKCSDEEHRYFDRLLSAFPNLKSVSLNMGWSDFSCELHNTERKYRDSVVDYITNGAERIEELGLLRGNDLEFQEPPDYWEPSVPPNLRLRKLHCRDLLFELSLTCLKDSLEELVLWVTMGVYPEYIDVIPRELHRLKKLKLLFGDHTCCSSVGNLGSLKNLVTLQISLDPSSTADVTEADVIAGLCSEVNSTLKELSLHYVFSLSEKCVSELCRTHPALTCLEINICNGLSDLSVQSIFYYVQSLESLKLWECNVRDEGLSGFKGDLQENEIEDEEEGYTYPIGYSLARLKSLRCLNLSGCPVQGEPFKNDLKLPELREATFKKYINENLISQENLVCFVKNHPLIEKLEIESASDTLIRAIIANLKHLKKIVISDKTGPTAECLEMLDQHCRNNTRESLRK